jgi:hypothetical protein
MYFKHQTLFLLDQQDQVVRETLVDHMSPVQYETQEPTFYEALKEIQTMEQLLMLST